MPIPILHRIARRLEDPDEALELYLRRTFAIILLGSLASMVMLMLVSALAASAPHPLSLFLGDLVFLLPLILRILAPLSAAALLLLLVLRLVVGRRLARRKDRTTRHK